MILTFWHAKLLIKFLYWGFANISFSIDHISNPIDQKYDFININFEKKNSIKKTIKSITSKILEAIYRFEYYYNYFYC